MSDHTDEIAEWPGDVQALHHQLEADSAAWLRSAPSAERLLALYRRAPGPRASVTPQQAALDSAPSAPASQPIQHPSARKRDHTMPKLALPRAARVLAACLAAAAVVALFAGVFASRATSRTRQHSSVGAPITTKTSTRQTGVWAPQPALDYDTTFDATDGPVIAPSNPKVVYEAFAANGQIVGVPTTMRRTTDGGAHWQNIPLPVADTHVYHIGFNVSPVNADDVFLTIFDKNAADCPADRAKANTEAGQGTLCWLEFTSADGGGRWKTTNLPLADGTPGIIEGTVSAQGNRLYATFRSIDFKALRLITSGDRGQNWQFADSSLVTTGQSVCEYVATPKGSTLYAIVPQSDCYTNNQTPLTLWASADGGAHWAKRGTLPTPNERGLALSVGKDATHSTLYLVAPTTTQITKDKMGNPFPQFSASPRDVRISTDDGATWTSAPTAGIPDGVKPMFDTSISGMGGITGLLADGTIVVEFVPQQAQEDFHGSTLYAWKPGDAAWRQIAPPVTKSIGIFLPVTTPDKHTTIYVALVDRLAGYGGVGTNVTPAAKDHLFSFLSLNLD